MDRGHAAFTVVFLVLPLLAFLAAIAVGGVAVELALALLALGVLVTGFTVALAYVEA